MIRGHKLAGVMLVSARIRTASHFQFARVMRTRSRSSPNCDAGGVATELETIFTHAQPRRAERRNPPEHPLRSIEVTELRGDEPSEVKQGFSNVTGKQVAQTIRLHKKPLCTRSQSKLLEGACFSKLNEVELTKFLRKHVIYADESLTILNKPYGISANGGDKVGSSLRDCLPMLSKMIYGLNSSRPLILCNRLDKGSTGILVCATNKDTSRKVMDLFRQQKVRRKYWAITLGTPLPRQGVVDIPLSMNYIEGDKRFRSHCKMALAPQQKLDYETGQMVDVRQRKSEMAMMHYRTLDSCSGLALVEVQPLTSAKHQIRVHLSEGLSCCILGDHKYSRPEKLLPQRLPSSVLSRFQLKPTKSRNMPMHLHLRELILPGILDTNKPNLLLSAKAPEHFYKTMKLFKLKPGKETDFVYPERINSRTTPKRNNALMEELYIDPFDDNDSEQNEVQRDDCYAVYKPKVEVKFQYSDS